MRNFNGEECECAACRSKHSSDYKKQHMLREMMEIAEIVVNYWKSKNERERNEQTHARKDGAHIEQIEVVPSNAEITGSPKASPG